MDFEILSARLTEALQEHAPSIVAGLVILVVGYLAVKLLVALLRRGMRRAKVEETLGTFLCSLANIALLALLAVQVLGQLGVATSSFAAIVAAAGFAVGFALKDSLGSFAAGVMLILFRPFAKGDFVEAAGISGKVEAIDIFATRLTTPDNKLVIVGNDQIMAGAITNYSAKQQRRVDLVVGIGYDDDIRRAKELLARLVSEDPRVLAEPATTIAVSELGDSSVNFVVRPWVATADYWNVHFDLTERIKLAFDEAGISIPFPQRDVHLHQKVS